VGECERQQLRDGFIAMMKERFLAGLDGEWFDYAKVDLNEAYDDVEQRGRDEEERWFDDEEAS